MQSDHDESSITPVCLLTGFLGSGKTTLLNHWLSSADFSDVVVIVNEFGDIGIDHALIVRSDDRTIELSNGCLCCTVSGDLVNTLRELLIKRSTGELKWFHKVLIETTGLADPSQLVQVFMTMPVARKYYLSKVVTVIDGIQGEDNLTRFPEAVRQLAIADHVIISKNDIKGCSDIHLLARIKEINPGAHISLSSFDALPTPPDLFDKHISGLSNIELNIVGKLVYETEPMSLPEIYQLFPSISQAKIGQAIDKLCTDGLIARDDSQRLPT
jgi:G3E family GTPase